MSSSPSLSSSTSFMTTTRISTTTSSSPLGNHVNNSVSTAVNNNNNNNNGNNNHNNSNTNNNNTPSSPSTGNSLLNSIKRKLTKTSEKLSSPRITKKQQASSVPNLQTRSNLHESTNHNSSSTGSSSSTFNNDHPVSPPMSSNSNNSSNSNSNTNSSPQTKRKIPLLSLWNLHPTSTLTVATQNTKEALETFLDETLQEVPPPPSCSSSNNHEMVSSPRISIVSKRSKSLDRNSHSSLGTNTATTTTTSTNSVKSPRCHSPISSSTGVITLGSQQSAANPYLNSLSTHSTNSTTNSATMTTTTSALLPSSVVTPQSCESSPFSPRVSFQRLTVGSLIDHEQNSEENFHLSNLVVAADQQHYHRIEDEYSQIMNSEIGRELFFQFIQKSSHSEQIEFLQDTIRLYQDNALLLTTTTNANTFPNSALSPVSPRGRRNSNVSHSHDTNSATSPTTNTTTVNTTQMSFSQPTHSFVYLSSPTAEANTSSSSLSSGSGTNEDTNCSSTSSSINTANSSSPMIGGLKKLVKSKSRANSASSDPNDKAFISTSEILMKYKQQQLQNIQQSLLQQQQQQQNSPSNSQHGTFHSHIYVGFNLLHVEKLIDKYILEHSPKELNLSKRQRQKTLDAFERLKNEKLHFLNTNVYPESAQVSEIPHHLYCDMFVSEDEFIEIFRDLINVINLQLKLECFRDFRKSPEYLEAVVSESSNDVSSVTGILSSQSKYPIDTIATPRRFFNRRRLSENDLSHLRNNSTEFNGHALLLSPRRDSTSGGGYYSWLQPKSNARSLLRNMKNPLELFMVLHHR